MCSFQNTKEWKFQTCHICLHLVLVYSAAIENIALQGSTYFSTLGVNDGQNPFLRLDKFWGEITPV